MPPGALIRAVALLLVFPSAALAQVPVRVFVTGGPILNQDMTWGGHRISNWGLGLQGGLRIGERTEIRVVVDAPPATTMATTHETYAGTPPIADTRVISEWRARNRTVAVLAGRLFGVAPRLQVSASAGLSSSRRTDRYVRTVETLATGARDEAASRPTTVSWSGPIFGAGLVLAVSRHLSLAPEARVIWYPLAENGNSILRTALDVRWTF